MLKVKIKRKKNIFPLNAIDLPGFKNLTFGTVNITSYDFNVNVFTFVRLVLLDLLVFFSTIL